MCLGIYAVGQPAYNDNRIAAQSLYQMTHGLPTVICCRATSDDRKPHGIVARKRPAHIELLGCVGYFFKERREAVWRKRCDFIVHSAIILPASLRSLKKYPTHPRSSM